MPDNTPQTTQTTPADPSTSEANSSKPFWGRMFSQKDPELAQKEKAEKEKAAQAEKEAKEKAEKEALEAKEKAEKEALELKEKGKQEAERAEKERTERIESLRKELAQLQSTKENTEETTAERKKEAERLKKELVSLRKGAAKERIAQRNNSTLNNLGADDAQKLNTKTKAVVISIGVLASTFYILAWAFPAFSAIISALVIGLLISATAYFVYKLYIRSNNAIRQLGDIVSNIETEVIPDLQTSAELALDTSKETAIEATHTLKETTRALRQFQEDTHEIRETLKKVEGVAEETAEKVLKKTEKTATDISNQVTDFKTYTQVQVDQLRLVTRQSFTLTGNIYPHNLTGVSYADLQAKVKNDCKAGRTLGSKNTAYIAFKPGVNNQIVCRFLNDQGTINNINIEIEDPLFLQKPIAKIAKENSEMILEAINLHILHINDQRGMQLYKAEMAASTPPAPVTPASSTPAAAAIPVPNSARTVVDESSPPSSPDRVRRRPSQST